jgi:channel protein (hemolysin III family)
VAVVAVFAASAVALLVASASYHTLTRGVAVRDLLQRLDHAAIFVLIAGTFTPVHTNLFRGLWRWGMLAIVWLLALGGITLKAVYFGGVSETVGMMMYLGMGWLGIVSGTALAFRSGLRHVAPRLLGGVAYMLGAVAEYPRWPVVVPEVIGWHEMFHVAVLAGLGMHWWFVWSIADARPTFFAGSAES